MENNFTEESNNTKKEDRKNLYLFIGIIVIIIITFVTILIVFLISRANSEGKDTGETNDIPPYVYFRDRSILTSTLDTNPANEVSSHIEDVILNEDEVKSAPSTNTYRAQQGYTVYAVTINTKSLPRTETTYGYVYSFNLTTSDDRKYNITLLEDDSLGNFYLGTIIKRTDKETKDYVFYDYNEDELYYGEEFDYKSTIDKWLSSYSLRDPVYNTSSLITNER